MSITNVARGSYNNPVESGIVDLKLISERDYDKENFFLESLDPICAGFGLQRENDGDSIVYRNNNEPLGLEVQITGYRDKVRYNITLGENPSLQHINGLTIALALEEHGFQSERDLIGKFSVMASAAYHWISRALNFVPGPEYSIDSVDLIGADIGARRGVDYSIPPPTDNLPTATDAVQEPEPQVSESPVLESQEAEKVSRSDDVISYNWNSPLGYDPKIDELVDKLTRLYLD